MFTQEPEGIRLYNSKCYADGEGHFNINGIITYAVKEIISPKR